MEQQEVDNRRQQLQQSIDDAPKRIPQGDIDYATWIATLQGKVAALEARNASMLEALKALRRAYRHSRAQIFGTDAVEDQAIAAIALGERS